MKYKSVLTLLFLTGLLVIASTKMAYSTPTTINYGNLTLTSTGSVQSTNWSNIWDLTKGDLTLDYTVNMTQVAQPSVWDTSYTEVGIHTEGAGNFNPGPWMTYQGGCGGWMTSLYGDLTPSPGIESLFDKHNLGASGGEGEGDYDCLVPNAVAGPFGTSDNYGIWFDRDTVDPFQATYWGAVNGGTYNTGGIYHIIIQYHAINAGLGSMFATVNGIQTGFYTAGWKNAQPEKYPAGLSFKGNMSRMQVFAGIWAPGTGYGYVVVQDLKVTGEPGVSDPLVVDFTYTQAFPTVHFTDTTHGGSTPYKSWAWDFNGDGITDSSLQNPTWTFPTLGDFNVKLTVTDNIGDGCCVRSITKTITAIANPVGGEWTPINTVQLVTPWMALALIAIGFAFAGSHRLLKKR